MQLTVDFGNTRTKISLFEGTEITKHLSLPRAVAKETVLNWLKEFPVKRAIWVASGVADEEMVRQMEHHTLTIRLDWKIKIPIAVAYESKDTLGMDRVALVCGAAAEFGLAPMLVVGLGTCVTYDFLNGSGYLGGGIAPGLEMRLKSLEHYTHKLPLVNNKYILATVGKTTEASIVHGTCFGMSQEINGMIDHYKYNHQNLKILITGGDLPFFAHTLKKPIFARPNLLAFGLNHILRLHHVQI